MGHITVETVDISPTCDIDAIKIAVGIFGRHFHEPSSRSTAYVQHIEFFLKERCGEFWLQQIAKKSESICHVQALRPEKKKSIVKH
jgi:hypothetical protein